MNKEKIGNATGQTAQLLAQTVLGSLCGVGAIWTLTALWPPSRPYVHGFGAHVETLSHSQPSVLLGLMLGSTGALLWKALKK